MIKAQLVKKKKKKDTRSFLSLAVGHTFPVISLDSVNAWREVTFPTFGIAAGQELVKLDLFTNCSNCLSALFYRRTGISMSHTVTKKKIHQKQHVIIKKNLHYGLQRQRNGSKSY